MRSLVFTLLLLSLLLGALVACGGSSDSAEGGGVYQWGLPFRTGTQVKIGEFGLHDDNFGSLLGGYKLNGAGQNAAQGGVPDASLDILTQAGPGTPVIPLASGRVLKAWPACHVVLVDHGDGMWVEYLHLNVAVSDNATVGRDTTLGYTLPAYQGASNCGDHSDWPHVHFAFLTGSGTTGHYVSMAGRVLCGRQVGSDGSLAGLGAPGGSYFAVPNCNVSSSSTSSTPTHDAEEFVSQSPNPTTVSLGTPVSIDFTERNSGNTSWSDGAGYALVCLRNCFGVSRAGFNGQTVAPNDSYAFHIAFQITISPGTYQTVWAMEHNGNQFGHDLWINITVQPSTSTSGAADSCSVPTPEGPSNTTIDSSADISLNWATDCVQSDVELWGGPYGTLTFGGWAARTSIDVGQMYAGTYSWHVRGESASGTTTDWSPTETFIIADSAASNPPPPASTPQVYTPYLVSPQDGATITAGQSVNLAFNYHAQTDEAYVELTTPTGVITFGWSQTTMVNTGPLNTLGQYQWRAKARDSQGNESSWSNTQTFTVIASPTPTACPYLDGGNGVTFYSGANYTGQSWTWYVPAGNVDSYANLPPGIAGHLGSFYDSNNAWHVVLYQAQNGTGNLGHYDASWANVDSYWQATQSVKIYINRSC